MIITRLASTGEDHAAADARDPLRSASLRQRAMRALVSEPWWLRGLHWRLVGMVLVIAILQNASELLRYLAPTPATEGGSWEFVLFDLTTQIIIGVAIMLIASVLANIERPAIPLPLALILAVVFGTWIPINVFSYFYFDGVENLLVANWVGRRIALPWAIAAAAWYFLRRANVRAAALRAAELARRQLETGMLEARLQLLHAQIEPHFLFNTLAHVRHLYRTDPLLARLMLDSFRAYLRSALPEIRGNGTVLGRELDLARAYLDIQQERMGPRLCVRIDVPGVLREREFPSMMLLSLVENALKHGLNPLPGGGSIVIGAAQRDAALEVWVADTGCGMGEVIGSGVGLANIRGRLAALYGPSASLSLMSNAPRGVRATILVPTNADAMAAPLREIIPGVAA